MGIAHREPASWIRTFDDKISKTSSASHRQMLATLKKRFVSAFDHDVSEFLSTFTPDFERITFAGGSVHKTDLTSLPPVIRLAGATWPALDRLLIDEDTIAIEGVFNVVLLDEHACGTIGVVVDEPNAKYLLSVKAALFLEFRGGLQAREIAYGATAPSLTRLDDDDLLCMQPKARR